MKRLCVVVFLFWLFIRNGALHAELIPKDWPKQSDAHFEIYYASDVNASQAREILSAAERFYQAISYRLGFNRYQEYWTWENRAKIVMYQDEQDYIAHTGAPQWTKGFSANHDGRREGRMIVSFWGQDEFVAKILPHEIGHLILHDFMKQKPIPVFFDEGVAQLEEAQNNTEQIPIMSALVKADQHIPFSMIETMRINAQFTAEQVSIFYAESLYIVEFLIKTYGKDKFVQLCRTMRDGLSFSDAVKKAYYPTVSSLDELENQWKSWLTTW